MVTLWSRQKHREVSMWLWGCSAHPWHQPPAVLVGPWLQTSLVWLSYQISPLTQWRRREKNNHRKRWDGFHSLISSIIPITKLGEGGSCQTGLQPHRHTRCTRVRTQHFWGSSQREQTTWQDSRCVSPWSQVGMNDILTSAASAFSSRL